MTPTTRNAAIAAAITIVPAIAAAAFYPSQTRALPGQITDRVRDLFEEEDDIEKATRKVVSRLDGLAHRLDARSLSNRMPDVSPGAAIAAGIAALVVIPAAITAIFAPHKFREAKDAALGYWRDDDELHSELSGLSERLDTLSGDIEKQRQANFDAVTGAKNAG